MRIPERIVCDLCEQDIEPGAPHAHVTIPMTRAQIEALIAANKAITPGPPDIVEAMIGAVPKVVTLEAHTECLAGISPRFGERAAHVLEHVIADGIKRHERRKAAAAPYASADAGELEEGGRDAEVTRAH